MDFVPDMDQKWVDSNSVKFFEDARADDYPFYSSRKSLADAQLETKNEMEKIGAIKVVFQSGVFVLNGLKRYGYRVHFLLYGAAGIYPCVGLPMKKENENKKERVLVQCLLNLSALLKAYRTSESFLPGSNPLIPHMLADSENTFSQKILEYVESDEIRKLTPPQEYWEGE